MFVLAVVCRIVSILQAGGFFAALNPDEGAYYGASMALAEGVLPYRDFLLLHPPGIAVLLAPFAALASVVGDADSMAAMRLGVVVLGGLNTVLVYRVALRIGVPAAVCASLFYAVWFPVVRVERTALLEPFVITAILVALLATTAPRVTSRGLIIGGLVAGVLATTKLYSIVPLAIITAALLITNGWRKAATFTAALAAGFVAVCLPFFVLAPTEMFRMVVLDQLGRGGSIDHVARLRDIFALTELDPAASLFTVCVCLIVAFMAVIAVVRIPASRLWVVLLVVQIGVLLAGPNLFVNYTAYPAAALALTVGAFAQAACGGVGARFKTIQCTVIIAAIVLTSGAIHLSKDSSGKPCPVRPVAATVAGATCVTADSATALILTNTFSRNIANGCPVVVDFTGLVYSTRDLPLNRVNNPEYQRMALAYLNQGDAIIIMRERQDGFTAESLADIQRRPVLYTNQQVTVYGALP